MSEHWKKIPEYPGYEVSDQGRIRSYHQRSPISGEVWAVADEPQRYLKGAFDRDYHFVALSHEGITHKCYIHTLVMQAFVGPCPEGMEVCHNDGNPRNNHLENLRYDSHHSNIWDSIRHGTHNRFTDKEVLMIREARAHGQSARELAQQWSVDPHTIWRLCVGRSYTHVAGPRIQQGDGKKLNWEIVKQIRDARRAGATLASLAQKYGVDQSYISLIVNNKRWIT